MITGVVNANRAATIPLFIRDAQGVDQQLEAIVDTGFNGSLTLPLATITQLGLAWRSRGQAVLANGTIDYFDIYAATVIWNGRPRSVLVEAVETDPLVGMSLLYGHDLHIQVLDGGSVTIT